MSKLNITYRINDSKLEKLTGLAFRLYKNRLKYEGGTLNKVYTRLLVPTPRGIVSNRLCVNRWPKFLGKMKDLTGGRFIAEAIHLGSRTEYLRIVGVGKDDALAHVSY